MAPATPLLKSSASKKEKEEIGQNIQVFVRSRPLNKAEKDKKAFSIVEFPSAKQIDVKEKLHSNLTKSYQFDKVFGPKSQQLDVYKAVVEPLIGQVMEGYNCTVFAYGQTGTGKTFTMEGGSGREDPSVTWETDPTAGIIPRALGQILDSLKEQSDNVEYSVKISFLELYNEEIFDLLSSVDDTSKLRLYEDAYKKGSVIIQGLEEVQVHTKSQVYKILEKGSEKRRTAETMMNAHSSRSHTVFSVTVHIKEASLEQEVLRIGKLNLVDLAGSENIGRSGAKDGRAREAGNINQSLLTLGRVITNLVERAPHIPYRESKLTRLLQDSLGGRTKTSIIATVSPATINLEETLSTLEYAYRARSILNRPEINARLSKEDLVKEYSNEMDRIKKDLMQLREKNGLYIAQENWQEMLDQVEENEKKVSEMTKEMIALHEEMEKKKKLFDEVEKNMIFKSREIQKVRDHLEVKEGKLTEVSTCLKKVVREKEEKEHLVSKHQETELKLGMQAKKLLVGCDDMDEDLTKLHTKLTTVRKIDSDNEDAKEIFKEAFDEVVQGIHNKIEKFGNEHEQSCETLKENLKVELTERSDQIKDLVQEVGSLLDKNEEIEAKTIKEVEVIMSKATNVQGNVESLENELTEVERKRGELFVKEILPSLQIISQKIGDHAKSLMVFKANVTENFEKITAKVNNDIKSIINIVKETGSFVTDHFEMEKETVDKMKGLNAQVLQSHEKMKTSLKSLETAYTEHYTGVDTLSTNVEEVLSEFVKKVSPMKGKIDANISKLTNVVDNVKMEVTESVEETQKQTKKSVEECQEITEDIVEATNQLKINSSTYVAESLANTEEVFTKVEETLSSQDKEVSKAMSDAKAMTASSKEIIQSSKSTINSRLVVKNETKVDSDASKLVAMSKTHVEEMKENIQVMHGKVKDLMDDGINIYQPSGETPVRVERQYPRYLAATSPHARILDRFRKAAEAEEAAQTPVDESMDSVISDSFKINTTGDENIRERTGSFSSDLNVSDTTSVASSKAKREIKKPETIKRNILGTSSTVNKD